MQKTLRWAIWIVPLLLWFDCAIRPITEPDLFFYFALIKNYLGNGRWPVTDPFLYTLPGDTLMSLHQWLGYWLYYLPYRAVGWAGPILLMSFTVALLLTVPLMCLWRARKPLPLYYPLVWTLVIFISHHRFRERVSLFGDLFTVLLASGLLWTSERRWFWRTVPLLFLLWAQLHPSYPLGWVILFGYFICGGTKVWQRHKLVALGLCLLAPLFNPLGITGLLYPFRFAFTIEPYLRQYVMEWLPLTDNRLFSFRFLYLPFFTIIPFVAWQLWRQRERASSFEWFMFLLAVALNVQSVRFGLMAQGLFLSLLTTVELRRADQAVEVTGRPVWRQAGLALLTVAVAFFKLSSSTTLRQPIKDRFAVDTSYFPAQASDDLLSLRPQMHIFNSFGFGGYLAWRWGGDPPLFFHGFSTNFAFYEQNYYQPQENQSNLEGMIRRFNIGIFFLSKRGNDDPFIVLLNANPGWQKIREDQVSVIFAKRDPRVFARLP